MDRKIFEITEVPPLINFSHSEVGENTLFCTGSGFPINSGLIRLIWRYLKYLMPRSTTGYYGDLRLSVLSVSVP